MRNGDVKAWIGYAHVMSAHADDHPWDSVTEEGLRKRKSAKWSVYGPAVLPLWVAEMDFPVAEPIKCALSLWLNVMYT
jgi:hypothetical protein